MSSKKKPKQIEHPGLRFRREYVDALNLSNRTVAACLGVTRKTISLLVNARQAISPLMATRIGLATDTEPYEWLEQQRLFDLQTVRIEIGELEIKSMRTAKEKR